LKPQTKQKEKREKAYKMDSLSESMNYKDTSAENPSSDINENEDDYTSELDSEEKMVPTSSNYSELSINKISRSQLERQPPDPFCNYELKTVSGTKNIFDLIVFVGPSNAKKIAKASEFLIHSSAWKWFEEVYIDNIQHGVCNVEMIDGKCCSTKVKTSDSMTVL
ncbi:211_t:CDS:2, partial [Dentiscutata erythropus]